MVDDAVIRSTFARLTSPDWSEGLQREPWRYGFLSLLRRIGANPAIDTIGTALRPEAEPFRLGQKPSLAFAPREIADARVEAACLKLRLFGLGVLGPQGPLPLHVTELARYQYEVLRDSTLVDFLDLFHHRYLTLFYRAWAAGQAAAGLDRSHDERFSYFVENLAGLATEPRQPALPSHALLAAATHLIGPARPPYGLCATLAHYFAVPVSVIEHVFHWIEIDPVDRGQIGVPGDTAVMGMGAVMGQRIPDRQYRFRLVLGPLDFETYLRFLPVGDYFRPLVTWVRTFVGCTMDWELELQLRGAPPAVMGGGHQMGWSGWLGRSSSLVSMCFVPERYAWQVNGNEQHS